jgi:hypothetical protein
MMASLDDREPVVHLIWISGQCRSPGPAMRREGVGGDLVTAERVQPFMYRPDPSGVHVAVPVPRYQVNGLRGVPGGQGVTYAVADCPPRSVPSARTLMEGRDYLWLGPRELGPEDLRE